MGRPSRMFRARDAAKDDAETGDLSVESRVHVSCVLCDSPRSRLVCSAEDIASQRAFLEWFYRSRWRKQDPATATDRVRFTQDYATAIVACSNCGLLYRDPRPASNAVSRAYEAEQYDGGYLWAEFEAQRAWARGKIREIEPLLSAVASKRPRVLEIGSFVGGFLAEGCAKGWDMLGIDPGRDVTVFSRGQRLPVFQGTVEEAGLSPSSFDAVAVWNAFDQLPDPHRLLRQAARVLRNGGLLMLRVPNGACFGAAMALRQRLFGRLRRWLELALAWNNLLSFPYLYGYAPEQLEGLVSEYGFRLIECVPDQVSSTPSGQLVRLAALEERAIKSLCRAAAAVDRYRGERSLRAAPWVSLYFERACADVERVPVPPLGVHPVYASMAFEDTGSDCRRIRWNREGGSV